MAGGDTLSAPADVARAPAPRGAAALDGRLHFRPRGALRGAHVQSTLGSLPPLALLARRRAAALLAAAQPLLLECGQGVRLQAFHSGGGARRRLAVLLHGWEGSARSSCVLSLGAALYADGFDVLRLNLRDHGDTQHLNRGIFHCCRLDEVAGAVRAIAARFAPEALYLAGFSLGGNFLLRVAAEPSPPAALRAVVAVSPVLEPAATLAALERGPALYRQTLVRRWSRSLRLKQRAWPGVHDFSALIRLADLRAMTAALVREHTGFAGIDEYLRGYALTGERLASLPVPCSLLLAEDDPLVPAADLRRLRRSMHLGIWSSRRGGHCGFIDGWSGSSAAERFVLERFAAAA
ncbi:MAG TPA: alpha/beta fold hydrolase [Steroidobacteraceae bacterium]|nr:alpha/beta fold hydrolase [Steroidobacteraceae bacterium]